MCHMRRISRRPRICHKQLFTKFRNLLLIQQLTKMEQFYKGVWGIAIPFYLLAVADCSWCGCWCWCWKFAAVQNILKWLWITHRYHLFWAFRLMRKTWTSRTINKDITLKSDISASPTVTDVIRPYTTVVWVSAYTDIFITCCGMEACKTNSIIPFNKCPQTTCVYPPVTTTLFTLSLSVNTSEERSRCRSQMWKYVNASISAGRPRNPYSWHTVTMGWGGMDL